MRYVSIDIETTGLDPASCVMIEIAAIVDDTQLPFEEREEFHHYINPGNVTGSMEAIAMHLDKWPRIVEDGMLPAYVAAQLLNFFTENFCGEGEMIHDKRPVVAGKNFASFDLNFLSPWFAELGIIPNYRYLDPTALWLEPEDVEPPDLAVCCVRAGIPFKDQHDALEDAAAVCLLLRKGLERLHGSGN